MKEYNVNMAATILTGLVPLIVYFVSGKLFVPRHRCRRREGVRGPMSSIVVRDLDPRLRRVKVLNKLNIEVGEGEFLVLLDHRAAASPRC